MFRFARLALVPLLFSTGCDLEAKSFSGAIINLSLTGVPASTGTTHLELWARNEFNDVLRINGNYDFTDPKTQVRTRITPYGFRVRAAITMNDPCMIDAAGNLLVTAAAYKEGDFGGGVHQTAEE